MYSTSSMLRLSVCYTEVPERLKGEHDLSHVVRYLEKCFEFIKRQSKNKDLKRHKLMIHFNVR